MIKKPSREAGRKKRHERVRHKISGTAGKPRLAVFRSNDHIYAQVIDDDAQHTLCAASTVEKDIKTRLQNTANVDAAKVVGEAVAKKGSGTGYTNRNLRPRRIPLPREGQSTGRCRPRSGAAILTKQAVYKAAKGGTCT
jgi:large subunit ribosomal protein L18